MQAATHLATGALLARALPRLPWLAAAIAALTHVLIDNVAVSTYHPPDPLLDDPFWIGFHLLVLAATLWAAFTFRRHGWILLAAMAPDLDWFIGRPLGLWDGDATHPLFRSIPGIAAISAWLRSSAPDLRLLPAAALLEIGLFAGIVTLARRLRARPALDAAPEAPSEGT
jgi:hypothetical protein